MQVQPQLAGCHDCKVVWARRSIWLFIHSSVLTLLLLSVRSSSRPCAVQQACVAEGKTQITTGVISRSTPLLVVPLLPDRPAAGAGHPHLPHAPADERPGAPQEDRFVRVTPACERLSCTLPLVGVCVSIISTSKSTAERHDLDLVEAFW